MRKRSGTRQATPEENAMASIELQTIAVMDLQKHLSFSVECINILAAQNRQLFQAAELMHEVLTNLISQKSIGKMAFDVGKLNEGFMKFEAIKRSSTKREIKNNDIF